MDRGSIEEMVYQLRHGYWDWSGGLDDHWRKFNFGSDGWAPKNNKIKVHFDEDDPIPRGIKELVKESFRYVGDVLNIKVTFKVADGDDGDINIHRVDDWDEFFGATEFAAATADLGLSYGLTDRDHYQYNPDISFDRSKFDLDDPVALMGYRTVFIHEFSHLLGLGHLGDYNGDVSENERVFSNDSRGYSLMSYVAPDQFEPGRFAFGGRPWTYREVDLAALQLHYGTEFSMEERATIWGFGGTVSHEFINEGFDLIEQRVSSVGRFGIPALTILDTGGEDTLNLRASVSGLSFGVRVDLTPGSYSDILNGDDNLFIHESSVVENIYTDDGADHITGNDANNEVFSGGGNDTILGGGGKDTIEGEAGADSIEGGGQNDKIFGGAGGDEIYGNGGGDQLFGGDDDDLIYGASGKDTLDGNDGDDTLYGDEGRDEIWLGDGGEFHGGQHNDEFLVGDAGAFAYEVYGDQGRDIMQFVTPDASLGFRWNMSSGALEDFSTGGTSTMTVQGLEKIIGSRVNDEFVIADISGNALTYFDARGGVDKLYVRSATITVTGGDQADHIWVQADGATALGGRHNDSFVISGVHAFADGEAGTDGITFASGSYSSVAVDASRGLYGYDTTLAALDEDISGRYSRFEEISVEEDVELTFSGRGLRDLVNGGAQNDTMMGFGGNDTFYGGGGDDSLKGSAGFDKLYGEEGNDTLIGGNGADTLYGGDGADRLETGDGNDRVEAGYGNDTIICGDGLEELFGEGNDDLFVVEVGEKHTNGGSGEDTLEFVGKIDRVVDLGTVKYQDELGLTVNFVNIENVITNDGDDSITGNSDDNHLQSNGGVDTLNGAGGDDTLDGGAELDTAEFLSGVDFTVNLSDGTAEGEGSDTLISIENVTTSGGDDTITGDDEDNILRANDGADSVTGAGGRDVMYGGAGNDTILAGHGVDDAHGEEGFDTLGFDAALDGVTFSLAITTRQTTSDGSILATGFEALRGTDGADFLSGDSAENIISGADGNDTLIGGDGADTVDGEAGNDTFVIREGDGDDSYGGGAGTDAFDFSGSSAGVSIRLSLGSQDLGSFGTDTWSSVENVTGSKFDDQIEGDAENNVLLGLKGADTLYGAKGDDALHGGDNDDTLVGGLGTDTLEGGTGADTFQFKAGHGPDLIADFNGAEGDVIQIGGAEGYGYVIVDGRLSLQYGESDWISFKGIDDPDQIDAYVTLL